MTGKRLRKALRKLMQQPYSYASQYRGDAFTALAAASTARMQYELTMKHAKGYDAERYLYNHRMCIEIARNYDRAAYDINGQLFGFSVYGAY